ncbi:hypothetical protein BSZ19_12830 [Bradyrhizobium japonicum]|uniref:Uncharacterized protein n=1 Tax=Bradyrhizobium japonicum TaxID=375 RepID=A0A1Y2JRJ9_BRAJP|nr:hypothetical protein BSZ19_12830 [Bradyrhizobium japonicum]
MLLPFWCFELNDIGAALDKGACFSLLKKHRASAFLALTEELNLIEIYYQRVALSIRDFHERCHLLILILLKDRVEPTFGRDELGR